MLIQLLLTHTSAHERPISTRPFVFTNSSVWFSSLLHNRPIDVANKRGSRSRISLCVWINYQVVNLFPMVARWCCCKCVCVLLRFHDLISTFQFVLMHFPLLHVQRRKLKGDLSRSEKSTDGGRSFWSVTRPTTWSIRSWKDGICTATWDSSTTSWYRESSYRQRSVIDVPTC